MEIFLTILIIILIIALIAAGLIGIFLPMLPGAPLILAGIFVYAIWDKFEHMSGWTFGFLVFLTVLISVIDYTAQIIGAKKFKASKKALWCAGIGMVVGLFTGNVFGFIVGPLVGAIIGELIDSRDLRKALSAGTGIFIGFLSGTLINFVIAMVMMAIFVGSIIF